MKDNYTDFLLKKLPNKLKIIRNDDIWKVSVIGEYKSVGMGYTLNSVLFDLCIVLGVYSGITKRGYHLEYVKK